METGVPGGKPLQRILGFEAYTNPADRQSLSPLSLLGLSGAAISTLMYDLTLAQFGMNFKFTLSVYRVRLSIKSELK